MGASWQAFYAHLCAASIIRAMPETEIPPAMRGDLYLYHLIFMTLYRICLTGLRAHSCTPFGVPCGRPLPLPLGEVAERSEDGEGKQ